ncbi:MAG: hypothetical protein LBB07_02015 [Bifidobacteriaceae bacterium]|jgi:hypothetical protein|nr:hypothetical protein [Bifidobacteriaceae bacterium]
MGLKRKINRFGAILSIFLLCAAGFVIGINQNQNALAGGSNSVLPISKGGTSANTQIGARENLKMMNSVSANSTDDEIPNGKEVYNFGSPSYNMGDPIESTTLTGTYFDAYIERYANKLARISIISNTIKANIPAAHINPIFTLSENFKAAKGKLNYPASNITFFNSSGSIAADRILYINCASSNTCKDVVLSAGAAVSGISFLTHKSLIYTVT